MKKILIFTAVVLAAGVLKAQTGQDAVKAAVNKLFTAMKASDSAGIVGAFTEGAILQSINEKDGKTSVSDEKVLDFAHVIAGMKKGDADERIKFTVVQIDGPLAIVWTPYQFFYKGVFSHCGVDSYQLLRQDGVWRIQYLVDTRRKGGCL